MFGIVWHDNLFAIAVVSHVAFQSCFPSIPNVLLIQVTAAGPTPGDKVGQTCCADTVRKTCCADVISNSEYLGIIFVISRCLKI